jgi:hypothetical protein
MPISAPKPNSPPSANCVEALCSTIAGVDLGQKALGRSRVTGDDGVRVVRAVGLDDERCASSSHRPPAA